MPMIHYRNFKTGETWDVWEDDAPAPSPEEVRAAWRSTRALSRAEFCTAAFRAGKMTAAEAIAAAKGETPALFESALSRLPPADQDEARILWAGLGVVDRNHPLVALAAWAADMTDEEVDALFGWTDQAQGDTT